MKGAEPLEDKPNRAIYQAASIPKRLRLRRLFSTPEWNASGGLSIAPFWV
jgi:hypothetical protein